jgi:hypothetical protein
MTRREFKIVTFEDAIRYGVLPGLECQTMCQPGRLSVDGTK